MAGDDSGHFWQQIFRRSQTGCFLVAFKESYQLSQLYKAASQLRRLCRQQTSNIQQAISKLPRVCNIKIPSIRRVFEKSVIWRAITVWLQAAAVLRSFSIGWGLPRWRPVIEAVIILLIVFMPVLNDWGLLLPLLLLLWLSGNRRTNPSAKELAVFLLALAISACLSAGLKSGISSLTDYVCYLGIAYLSGKAFSVQFGTKIAQYICYSSLLWIVLGLAQQWVGVPTPPGWLGREQGALITVRSYSLFGNPNIYALYLLSVLVLICYLISKPLASPKLRFWPILLLILVLISLYFTYARFAWLIGIAFLCFWFRPKQGKWRWLFLLVIPLFLLTIQGFRVRTATLLNLSDSSMWYRLRIWRGVVSAIAEFWLWGAGPGSFQTIYPWYQIKNTVSAHAHQLYLQIWLENGILSLAAFLSLAAKMSLDCFADRRSTQFAFVTIVFLVYGFVETWSQNLLIGGYFWLFCGLWISSKSEEFMTE
jgi:putative inorganic carbon (HCO3(-)) transporter